MTDQRWVSQSEAARLETAAGRPVAQSSISRFLDANPDVLVQRGPTGKVTVVEYGALARARASSLSVNDKLVGRATEPVADLAPTVRGAVDAAARKRAADAERAELDLAERKRELLSRSAVLQLIEAAGATFIQGLERRRRTLAQKVAGVEDVRLVEHELKSADRTLLEAFVTDLTAASAAPAS